MTRLQKIENSVFKSNTYILWKKNCHQCYLVDCGDIDSICKFLTANNLRPHSLFLTHGHFDHIYGLNDLYKTYSEISIYASDDTVKYLFDNKLNYSRYYERPFVFEGLESDINRLHEGQKIYLWDERCEMDVISTPGHDVGCISFLTKDYFFTGDSYIPTIKTVTNLRGNRQLATANEVKIKTLVRERHVTLCPGHGPIYDYNEFRRIDQNGG